MMGETFWHTSARHYKRAIPSPTTGPFWMPTSLTRLGTLAFQLVVTSLKLAIRASSTVQQEHTVEQF